MRGLKKPEQSGFLSTWGGTPRRAPTIGVQVMNFLAKHNKIIYIVAFKGHFGHMDSNLCTATNCRKRLIILNG
jgi:hypothetical protein